VISIKPEDQRPLPCFCNPERILTVKGFLIFTMEVGRDGSNLGLTFFQIFLISFQGSPKKGGDLVI